MLRKVVYSLTLTLIFTLSFEMLKDSRGWLEDVRGKLEDVRGTKIPISITEPPVKVFARVGGYMINLLSGWTSPYAEVTLSSQGLARKTIANEIGYFEFNFIPVPENIGEICLIAQDVDQLPTFPTCLAPPPRNMNLEIKDVLLSPSISLASGAIPVGRTTKASGMTFPDSEVEVYLFTEPRFSLWANLSKNFQFSIFNFQSILKLSNFQFLKSLENPRESAFYPRKSKNIFSNLKLVKDAEAMGLPKYMVKSNENGYFEFSLPANTPSVNRVYAAAIFSSASNSELIKDIKGNLEEDKEIFSSPSLLAPNPLLASRPQPLRSPKSNTLSFRALGILGILGAFLREFFRQAGLFFANLKNDPLGIIFIEILILLGLIGAILARRALQEKDPRKSARNPR